MDLRAGAIQDGPDNYYWIYHFMRIYNIGPTSIGLFRPVAWGPQSKLGPHRSPKFGVPTPRWRRPPRLPPRIPASPAPPRPTVVGGRIRRPRRDAARRCLTRLPASFKRHGVAIGVQPDSVASAPPMPRAGGWDSVRRRQGTPAPVSLWHGMSWYGLQLYCTASVPGILP